MATGAVLAVGALVLGLGRPDPSDALGAVLLAPTLLAAPASTLAIVVVSLRSSPPEDLDRTWRLMHGTAADRAVERLARLTREQRLPRGGAV